MLFHLTSDDHIRIMNEQGPETNAAGTTFASEQEFHDLAKEWPMKRLVEIWNHLPECTQWLGLPIARPRSHGSGEPFIPKQKQIVRARGALRKRNTGRYFARARKRRRSTLCCAGQKAPP